MNTTFPPGFVARLTSMDDPMSMLSVMAKRRIRIRQALRLNGPMSANELEAACGANKSKGDTIADVTNKTLASLVADSQVYQLASTSRHKRYALTALGMAHA
ncbi:MAG TPA: hypothetical protein PK861_00220 [Thermomonas sp.]|nr:hypothetical protein [Thermomonas sp.]